MGAVWRCGLRYEHSIYVTPGTENGYRENRVLLTVGYRPKTGPDANDPGV